MKEGKSKEIRYLLVIGKGKRVLKGGIWDKCVIDNGEIVICVENDLSKMEYIVATLNKFPQVREDVV